MSSVFNVLLMKQGHILRSSAEITAISSELAVGGSGDLEELLGESNVTVIHWLHVAVT